MLVLSRKKCEAIRIGDNIRIVVVRIQGDKVRIGIEAPRDVLVLREEMISGAQDQSDDEGTIDSDSAGI